MLAPLQVFQRKTFGVAGSGVGTGGSGGSMNRAPELLGPSNSGPQKILGKTLWKIIKIVATR